MLRGIHSLKIKTMYWQNIRILIVNIVDCPEWIMYDRHDCLNLAYAITSIYFLVLNLSPVSFKRSCITPRHSVIITDIIQKITVII